MANWFERHVLGYNEPEDKGADSTSLEEKGTSDRLSLLTEIAADRADAAGEAVDMDSALKVSAVFACARVIAEDLAKVPCKLYRKASNGSREEAEDHPLFDLLQHSPNDWQTSFEFREQIGLHLALARNAYVFVNRDSKGRPLELYAFEPKSVTVTRHNDYTLTYSISTTGPRGGSSKIAVPAENMWHLRGPSWDGVIGLDAVEQAREAIGLALATERYGSRFFKNNARPSGLLATEQALNSEQVAKLKQQWNDQQAGSTNAHKTAVLPHGLKFQPIASNANEAQWTESRRYQVEEICRFFRVNPVMVMNQANATSYASIEQLFLAHVQNTMMPWFQRFEQSAYKALLTEAEKKQGYFIKLNEKALLRASTEQRVAYYREGITNGWLTRNEVREREDLPRSNDPLADLLTPAANLFGGNSTPSTDEVNKNDD